MLTVAAALALGFSATCFGLYGAQRRLEDEPALSAAETFAFLRRFTAVVCGSEEAASLAREPLLELPYQFFVTRQAAAFFGFVGLERF